MIRSFLRTGRFACTIVLLVTTVSLGACATRSRVSASNEIATAMFAIRDARANGAETYSLERLRKALGNGMAESVQGAEKPISGLSYRALNCRREQPDPAGGGQQKEERKPWRGVLLSPTR